MGIRLRPEDWPDALRSAAGWCVPPFRKNKTILPTDEVYIVLSGELVLANPERGEVHRVRTGEAAFFRRDTWHHGFSCGTEPLHVLEYFAPPPSQGTGGMYARTKPHLERCCYGRDDLLGEPLHAAAREGSE